MKQVEISMQYVLIFTHSYTSSGNNSLMTKPTGCVMVKISPIICQYVSTKPKHTFFSSLFNKIYRGENKETLPSTYMKKSNLKFIIIHEVCLNYTC